MRQRVRRARGLVLVSVVSVLVRHLEMAREEGWRVKGRALLWGQRRAWWC